MDSTTLLVKVIELKGSALFINADAPPQIKTFERDLELNIALHLPNAGRFRVNVFSQRGEIRDRETMQQALACAETGHLCVSTLHANNANQAFDRSETFFTQDIPGGSAAPRGQPQ